MQMTRAEVAKGLITPQPLLKLTMDYGSFDNNGNLRTQWIETGLKTFRQSYGYDAASRLMSYQEVTEGQPGETARSQVFGMDGFGNLWTESYAAIPGAAAGVMGRASIHPEKNQLSFGLPRGQANPNYDAAGNLLTLAPYAGLYDAENRLVRLRQGGVDQAVQEYDAEGRRVKRTANGVTVSYVYDGMGELAAEYGGTPVAGPRYLVADHLGSTRLVLDGSGGCVNRSDYLPYGFEMYRTEPCYGGNPPAAGGVAGVSQRFTGKERDAETGLDYFGARYMASAQGRFTSPDP
jgi:RHS repeat-associated protein